MPAMRALSLVATPVFAFAFLLVGLLGLIGQGCSSSCSTSDDCSAGEVCLFPVGGGCGAQGHCGTQDSCIAKPAPIALCSCATGLNLALPCPPTTGIPERTTTGACGDAGPP
jgi:hypothetical protein